MRVARPRMPWREPASRRREVAGRLAELGLAGGARSGASRSFGAEVPGDLGARIRDACLELGPAFRLYGRYLASRADLLPPADCLALAEIPDAAAPVPAESVRARIATDLGDPGRVFASFDDTPLASGLLCQWHRATAPDGGTVVVKVVRPDLDERLGGDSDLLELLRPPGPGLDGVVADHLDALAAARDLGAEAEGLRELAAEDWDGAPLSASEVLPELSSDRVLSVRWPDGTGLEAAARSRSSANLARRLAVVWLRQALLGRAVPVETGVGNLLVMPGGGVAVLGGLFAFPPPAAQEALDELLAATAGHEPEAACEVLARESATAPGAADRDTLLLRLRQVVPFRDGAWSPGGLDLPELLFGYWRAARECGYRTSRPLTELLRGLLSVAAVARSLAPEADPLREAFRDVRLEAGFGRLRGGAGGVLPGLAPYASLLSQLPHKLDELLSLAAEGETHLKLHLAGAAERRRRADAWVAVGALAVALVVVALVLPRLLGPAAPGPWADRALTAVVAVLGLALLRAAGRGG